MPQGRLAHVLRGFSGGGDGRLLVGPETFDDAGVVELGRAEGLPAGVRLCLVQTVDFFPPVVDDPTYYGAIAAANALSDVYAMGGRPISALCLAAFPRDFPPEWTEAILRGGFEKLREAGAVLAGGHTVESAIQFGFAVTGVVERERVTANDRARPGDLVYLTKPLGMGSFTTAAKRGKIGWSELEPAARQMATLNRAAAEAMLAARAHAATDVTGYGLVGHAFNVARASGVTIALRAQDIPLFPGALELSRQGHNSGAAKRGRTHLGPDVELRSGLEEPLVNLFFDAETSGGLLIFLAPEDAPTLERELAARGLPVHAIGACHPRGEQPITIG
jgi:selenide,water dikinase